MRLLTNLTALMLASVCALACTEDADIAQRNAAATGGASTNATTNTGTSSPTGGTSNTSTSTPAQTGGASSTSTIGTSGGTSGNTSNPTSGTTSNVGGSSSLSTTSTNATGGTSSVTPQTTRSTLAPITNPDISDSEYATFIDSANEFGFQLTQKAETLNSLATKNVVFSPTSAQIALAMAYAGAASDTATQMAATLHDVLGQAKYHAGSNRLLRDLKSRNREGSSAGSTGPLRVELAPANSLWVEQSLPIKASFLDVLSQNYDSGLQHVNFLTQAEPAREAINQWVMGHTHDKIKDLLRQGDVDSQTRLVLVNALYLYANWAELFDESLTKPGSFNTLSGEQVQASMMHDTRHLAYKSSDLADVVQLPYYTGDLWMTLVLPKAGQFETIRASTTSAWLSALTSEMTSTEIQLTLPKFKIETAQIDLNDALKQLGMTAAFANADFSGIADTTLVISKVVQKAFIGVDEKGTEAAAATALAMAGAIPMPTPVSFDRPFLFFIQDKTGLVLFNGHVVDPTK